MTINVFKNTSLLAVILLCVSPATKAEFNIDQYQQLREHKIYKEYIDGFLRGVLWNNVLSDNPDICFPPNEPIDISTADRAINIAKSSYTGITYLEQGLYLGLRDMYSCDKANNG